MKSCVGMARNKVTEWNRLRKLPTHTTLEVTNHWKARKIENKVNGKHSENYNAVILREKTIIL